MKYVFNYKDGKNTTTGNAGSIRIAGKLFAFESGGDAAEFVETQNNAEIVKTTEFPYGWKRLDAIDISHADYLAEKNGESYWPALTRRENASF